MTVYIDVILMENLCMNYIILFTTGFILKIKMKQLRLILSSLLGSIYAVVSYMNLMPIVSHLIMKIILSIAMIYIAFHPKNAKLMIKQLIMFYLISFVFGGCAFALLYFVKPQNILIKNGVFVGTYPIKIAILAGIVGFVITQIAFKVAKSRLSKKDMFCKITIYLKENEVTVKALIDSGNLLKDPISGMPVVVVEKSKLYHMLPESILNHIDCLLGGDDPETTAELEKSEYISKFRIIPFSSLGRQNGLLLGFKADYINILIDDTENKIENVIIGIYDKSLTKNGTYTALVGLEILEGSEKNEYITNVKV